MATVPFKIEARLRELGPDETALAYEAIRELRPYIGSKDKFVDVVNTTMRNEGYRLVGAFVEGEEFAVAAAGFRLNHFFARGHHLYCDDFVCLAAFRGQGYGHQLLDWLVETAKEAGATELHLDSGVGTERYRAHRLYFTYGMRIMSYHFMMPL